ncbi:arylsulfatase A, putative [Talaromyces stipitatus ATCC 10500]|uniref:Arylsulfatase A, putative n=1 Tax=Talaromyces stipitatus (strain ATCC 10500 / CBS 375.48 / QM 6759 / NRRL 1006) TaxID=441959 RepID=B8M2K4_TALSN|nr:arylsulfatase A, putative [Talaromyces stipitatus ATCC 10500]EED21915.1 arylsulfatase A, putative [Talaromyces stipitatus ATCC 10500]
MPHPFTKFTRETPPSGLLVQEPNLVIFMPDQLRWDALGCNGNPIAKTPNIDRFSQRGTRFTNCYVQNSMCTQSRCSMFLGLYPHVSGHRSLNNMIKSWEPNMFRSLKEAGYHVACLAPRGDTYAPTVTELSMNEYGFIETPDILPGFMMGPKATSEHAKKIETVDKLAPRLFYKGLRDQSAILDYDEAAVRSAEKFLEHPPEGPWVLYLPLIFPHVPFQVEEPYFSLYDRKSMPTPARLSEKTGYEPKYMEAMRHHYGLDKIDNLGLWDSTVTMFFTDHGEYLGDYGLVEKWPTGMSDSLTREPLIIAGAGLPQGNTFDDMAEMVDLVPSVFQLCSIPESFPTNGKSWIAGILHGTLHKEYAFVEAGYLTSEEPLIETSPFPYDIKADLQHKDSVLAGKAVAVRNKSWTYIYRLYEPAELYSRERDPQELHNLAGLPEYQPTVRLLESVVFRWMVETSDFLPYAVDPRVSNVDLEDPNSQWERRVKAASSKIIS